MHTLHCIAVAERKVGEGRGDTRRQRGGGSEGKKKIVMMMGILTITLIGRWTKMRKR